MTLVLEVTCVAIVKPTLRVGSQPSHVHMKRKEKLKKRDMGSRLVHYKIKS